MAPLLLHPLYFPMSCWAAAASSSSSCHCVGCAKTGNKFIIIVRNPGIINQIHHDHTTPVSSHACQLFCRCSCCCTGYSIEATAWLAMDKGEREGEGIGQGDDDDALWWWFRNFLSVPRPRPFIQPLLLFCCCCCPKILQRDDISRYAFCQHLQREDSVLLTVQSQPVLRASVKSSPCQSQ